MGLQNGELKGPDSWRSRLCREACLATPTHGDRKHVSVCADEDRCCLCSSSFLQAREMLTLLSLVALLERGTGPTAEPGVISGLSPRDGARLSMASHLPVRAG